MRIEKAKAADWPRLMEIWAAAVRATHHFLSEEDFNHFQEVIPRNTCPVSEVYLAAPESGPGAEAVGFISLSHPEDKSSPTPSPSTVEMLFVDPAFHRQGIGSALLDFARAKYPALLLDVNEQNPGALAFYQSYGFRLTGRSELDASGRPYPLLHMRFDG